MWVIFISYFCTAGICNIGSQIGPGFTTHAACERARTDLANGKALFFSSDTAKLPLEATECKRTP